MAFKNDGVQVAEYVYDFDVDGGAAGTIDLHTKANRAVIPVGGVVTAVTMKVVTAFTSGGSSVLSWGSGDDADGYSGVAIAVASLTDNFLATGWDNAAAELWDDTNDHMLYKNVSTAADGQLIVTIATADMTAGKAIFLVQYYMPKEQ